MNRQDKIQTINIAGEELYLGEVDDMCDAILHNQPTRIPLNDSRENIAAILALLESAKSERPIVI